MLSATLILATALAAASNADDCPLTCPAYLVQTPWGTLPPGVNVGFGVLGPLKSGTGIAPCATCTQCSQQGLLGANDPSGVWCFTLDVGSGPSQPVPKISRFGYMLANCDGQNCFQVKVTTCSAPVIEQGSGLLVCVYCGCE